MTGDFSLSGGCDFWPCQEFPDANFSSLAFDFNQTWVGVVIEDFQAHFDLDVELNPSEPTNEIEIPLLGSNGLALPISVRQRLSP